MNFSYGWYITWNCSSLETFPFFMSCTRHCLLNLIKPLFSFGKHWNKLFWHFWSSPWESRLRLGLEKLSITINIPLAKPDSLSSQNNLLVHVASIGNINPVTSDMAVFDLLWDLERKRSSAGLLSVEWVWVCSVKGLRGEFGLADPFKNPHALLLLRKLLPQLGFWVLSSLGTVGYVSVF